ncbi:MAG: phosphatase PAP2 family protein [Chlamydiales bacterium]
MTIHQNLFPKNTWNTKALLFLHLSLGLIILSWNIPSTRLIWDYVDQKCFIFLHNWIQTSTFWQNFWAIANHKRIDWLHDIFMTSFFLYYIKKGGMILRVKRIAELLISILCFFSVICLINKTLIPTYLSISRHSPSLTYEGAIRLSTKVDWLYVKDHSRTCFPADHGTTAVLFVTTVFFLMGRRVGFIGLLYGILFCLPRLVVGAHYLSDILIGSAGIALFALTWLYFTPAMFFLTKMAENIIYRCNRVFNRKITV